MSPKPGLFVQETPNNSGCGINNPLGKNSRVVVLTRDLHDAGVLSEPRAAVREALRKIHMNLCKD